jgi:hypothetical protein
MDHSVIDDPEYDRYVDIADMTLAIPRTCYHKFKARRGGRVELMPQSGNVREMTAGTSAGAEEPAAFSAIPRPRLGYWGPLSSRVNRPLVTSLLGTHPKWHFVYVDAPGIPPLLLHNAHSAPWETPEGAARHVQRLDVGFMPYDCHDEAALHCVPLKMFDYFAYGIPVVSTPVIHLWEYKDLVYLGDSPEELAAGVKAALNEPIDSPKRAARMAIARKHSLKNLATFLRGSLPLEGSGEERVYHRGTKEPRGSQEVYLRASAG